MITTEQIKELRDVTGVSVMQCKKALEEAEGDFEKAKIVLRKYSSGIAAKKAERNLGSGVIGSYIHNTGRVGVMVELLVETDFVAKNEEFKNLAREIAMHITASNPEFAKASEISEEAKQKAREIFAQEAGDKPAEVKEKIIAGKLDAYFKEKVLLDQAFIKNPERTINDLIQEATQKFGERIEIGRFVRFALGE